MTQAAPLLDVRSLGVSHVTRAGCVSVLRDLSFGLQAGETLGVVGESGSGKSQTALALMGLLPASARVSGAARFGGDDLLAMPPARRRALCGHRIAMVFQDPMSSLNPYLRIGTQLAEVMQTHRAAAHADAWAAARRALDVVQIADAARRLQQYPHELSGGMRQRVMIAMAIIAGPQLLIADEPTTALDPTVQAQILRLLAQLRADLGLAVMLISHDLGVIAETCDRVLVMYSGAVVEQADTTTLLARPRHPYTAALLAARPGAGSLPGTRLPSIPGQPPSPAQPPPGCRFAPRCGLAQGDCIQAPPPTRPVGDSHVACLRPLSPRR